VLAVTQLFLHPPESAESKSVTIGLLLIIRITNRREGIAVYFYNFYSTLNSFMFPFIYLNSILIESHCQEAARLFWQHSSTFEKISSWL
jgi:hypothetical protein